MNESNSIETLSKYSNLSDRTKFILNEMNKIKYIFTEMIKERKIMTKKLSKYIAAFDYFDKTLIILSATSAGISIISSTSVIGVPVGIASQVFVLYFL